MCRQVSLIWSYSRFSSPRSKRFYAFIFASCKRVREIPHYLDSHSLQWVSCPELWNKAWREKHRGFGFALLVIYGEDPSILLCSAGTGDAGGNSGKRRIETRQQTPPPPPNSHKHVGGRWGQLVPPAFEIQCSRVHTHTLIYTQKHTQKTNSILRGIPDLCLHLRSDYSPFCCETNDSLLSDLLSASSSYRTVHTNLSSFLLYL